MNLESQAEIERRGRRIGGFVFVLLVALPTVVWASQVMLQAFDSPEPAQQSCDEGLRELLAGLERARASASPAPDEGEAIEAFRANLGPIWKSPRSVLAACKGYPARLSQYGKIERLRYAEEHAVRYAARGLAADRIAVEKIRGALRASDPPETP